MSVRNADCQVTNFQVTPRGAIGQAIAELVDLTDKLKQEVSKTVGSLCK